MRYVKRDALWRTAVSDATKPPSAIRSQDQDQDQNQNQDRDQDDDDLLVVYSHLQDHRLYRERQQHHLRQQSSFDRGQEWRMSDYGSGVTNPRVFRSTA